nr:hypothetical protein [Tanacetum cinerariifolium]
PVTQHYLPKRRESVFTKPDHMITSSESRNSSKNMPRFSSNDMVHNHYLDEARKKTQERDMNSKTSEVNSCAKIQSHRTRNSNKRVEQKSHTQKPGRQIFTGHRFSPNNTSIMYEKASPRSDLREQQSDRWKYAVSLVLITYQEEKQNSKTLLLEGFEGLEVLALSHTYYLDLFSVLLDVVNFPHLAKILPVGIHLRQVLGTKFSTLEALKGLILNIPGAIILSLFTTDDSQEEGVEFEVTGFDKAFDSPTVGKTLDLGRGVIEYSLDPEEEGGFPKIECFLN